MVTDERKANSWKTRTTKQKEDSTRTTTVTKRTYDDARKGGVAFRAGDF